MTRRTALVTGASRGIGAAIADRLERDGLDVLRPTRAELDLSSTGSISAWLAGNDRPVDVLVNNAGFNRLGGVGEVEPRDLAETVQVNLAAPLQLIAGLSPGMKARGWGRVVNIGSIWGSVARERRVAYSAAKSGLIGLTRTLALELAPHVLVNVVAPGYVDTELTRRNNAPAEIARIEASIPLGRLARPEEIASLVAWLCSEDCTYVTGQTWLVDGGYTVR